MGTHRIAGVTFKSTAEFASALDSQRDGVGPWMEKNDVTGIDGLERAVDDAGPWRHVVADVVRRWLADDDVATRTAGVVTAAFAPADVGAAAIVALLRQHPERFATVKSVGLPTNQPDLRWSLLLVLGDAAGPDDVDAVALLKEAAREPRGYWLTTALARLDLAWLLDHAATVVPKWALGGALSSMPDTARRITLVQAMAPWTDAERIEALAESFWSSHDDADAVRAVLLRA